MKIYDVIIIGGGAAGCMAAVSAGRITKNILIIEKNDKLAKKIYASGNGKCNLTNEIQNTQCYRSTHPLDAFNIINNFDKDKTLLLFRELGILPKNKNGYYYPYSEQASSVAAAFVIELKRCMVDVVYSTIVEEIKSVNKNVNKVSIINKGIPEVFKITAGNNEYFGYTVVIAMGGMASPVHGSDGSGYKLAKKLGHKLIKPLPALTQLRAAGSYFKMVSGVRFEGAGRLYVNNVETASEQGEFLFTAYGISGIPVLQMSRFAARALSENKRVTMSIDFFPDFDEDAFIDYLAKKFAAESHKTIEEVLQGIMNNKLVYVVLKELKMTLEAKIKMPLKDFKNKADLVDSDDIIRLGMLLKNFIIEIIGTNGFDNAQATSGGISLMEVNKKTMESFIMPGIYFAGEILDVDGTCGGYNLQWAFSTGYIAGRAAAVKAEHR